MHSEKYIGLEKLAAFLIPIYYTYFPETNNGALLGV
jgi:hypothetical protein